MSSMENIKMYIPKDASVKNIPVQCLPSSIARKIGVQPLPRNPERSASSLCQTAMWICPVELREKGAAACKMAHKHCVVTQGQMKLPILSANPTASRIFHHFFPSDKIIPQASELGIPLSCSKVSCHRQNAIILYDGQVFLSVRKRKKVSGQACSQNPILPVSATQNDLLKAPHLSSPEQSLSAETQPRVVNSQQGTVLLPQVSPHTAKQPQEELRYGAAADSCSYSGPMHEIMGKFLGTSNSRPNAEIRNTIHGRSENGDNQKGSDCGHDGEPKGKTSGCPSNEEHKDQQAGGHLDGDDQSIRDKSHVKDVKINTINTKKVNVTSRSINISGELQQHMETEAELENGADDTSKAVEDCKMKIYDQRFTAKEAHSSDTNGLPVISHVISLAQDWEGAVNVMGHGSFCSSPHNAKPEEHQNWKSLNVGLTSEVSAQSRTAEPPITSPEPSCQENEELLLPLEKHKQDFEDLEHEERIIRFRNVLKKMEAKLKTVANQ